MLYTYSPGHLLRMVMLNPLPLMATCLLLWIALHLCATGFCQLSQQGCYWPDGTDTSTGSDTCVPCSVNANTSTCCVKGDLCLSTGVCFGPRGGQPYRAACTDKTWSNKSACPDLCTNSESSQSIIFVTFSERSYQSSALLLTMIF